MTEILTNGKIKKNFNYNGYDVLCWNTLREYSKEGQRIIAVQNKEDVLFFDLTRNIDGVLKECKFDVHSIMKRYDKGHYLEDFETLDNYCIKRDLLNGEQKIESLFVDENSFNEDKDYKIPIENIDFIELDNHMRNYEVYLNTGEPTRKYRGTKCILIRKGYVIIH